MLLSVALLLYGLSFVAAYGLLTVLSKVDILQGWFFRVLTGGVAGGVSATYLTGVIPFISYCEASFNGDFGAGGYVFFISLVALVCTWAYNIYTYRVVVL